MNHEVKPKLYAVAIGSEQMLVRAKTKQGAVAHAARSLVQVELASQEKLVAMTKAGVEIVDAIDSEPDLIGDRKLNCA